MCLGAGFAVGQIIKKSARDASAASSNIIVTNNNQTITHDQGAPTISRTSTVTIKDTTANYGYVLSAKLSNNSIPGANVKIGSSSSTTCPTTVPCTITTSSTPTNILETRGTIASPNAAISAQGATTDWTVTITLPANTPVGNYLVDIEYSEAPYIPPCPVLQGKTYLQDIQTPTNSTYGNDTRVVLKDRRNNQDYYVQNIVNNDGSCTAWMETNLRYEGGGDNTYGDTKTLTMTPTGRFMGDTASAAEAYTVPGVLDLYARGQGTDTLDTTNPQNNTLFYGYLYNWCAAMGGQASACNNTETNQANLDTSISICPAGWRLPTGGTATITDFKNLNNAVNGGPTNTDQGLRDNWLGVYSGVYRNILQDHGSDGYYSSSTVFGAVYSHNLHFPTVITDLPGTGGFSKHGGQSIRCVKDTRPKKTLSDMTYLQDLALFENAGVCANSPDRTRVTLTDRRNGQQYYVEKISGSGAGGTYKCWMETNLRYAGGGNWDSSWGYLDDRDTLTLRSSGQGNNTTAEYMNPGGSTTLDTTTPTNNTTFYGYLYNWCAAMGGQTNACNTSSTTGFSTTISICPAGWRLPTGGDATSTDFKALNNVVNGGSTTNDQGLRNAWLGVYSGGYINSLSSVGGAADYWSSSVGGPGTAYDLGFRLIHVIPGTANYNKYYGLAIRCLR